MKKCIMVGYEEEKLQELETLWYNGASRRSNHYDSTRYHALNLHSVFSKGTMESRRKGVGR